MRDGDFCSDLQDYNNCTIAAVMNVTCTMYIYMYRCEPKLYPIVLLELPLTVLLILNFISCLSSEISFDSNT